MKIYEKDEWKIWLAKCPQHSTDWVLKLYRDATLVKWDHMDYSEDYGTIIPNDILEKYNLIKELMK